MVNCCDAVWPPLSLTRTVKVKVPPDLVCGEVKVISPAPSVLPPGMPAVT